VVLEAGSPGSLPDAVEIRKIFCPGRKSNPYPLLAHPEAWAEEEYDKR
jgi:hypothetical protein